MPPLVVTYLGFPLLLALLVGVHLFVRNVSWRALGGRETTTPLWRRLLVTVVGPLAGYLTCVLFFVVAILGFGRQESSLRVSVTPTGPAYEAGLRDGDRVVAMNGARPASWDELRAMIQDNGDPPIDMQVERGMQTLHFGVKPRDGRIGVASIIERREFPFGLAATSAMAAPLFSIARRARELTEPVTLMGPVAVIVRKPSPWPALFRLGELASYAWPFSILIAFVVSRSSRRRSTDGGRTCTAK
jgi:membrane-associated protease RseP (regulator of RpoE activity)